MNEAKDHKEAPSERKPTGVIIDATSHRKSRLHQPEIEQGEEAADLDFLKDVPLKVNVVLAETTMPVAEILALGIDSVVQLNKPAGDPVDIHVENQKLGKGEVIVLQEKLRIRILEITPPLSTNPGRRTSEKPEEK